MNTRYYEMIVWSLMYGAFALSIIFIYYQMNNEIKLTVYCGNRKNIKIADVLILIILISIVSIRCNCGSDYYNYYIMYNESVNWYHSLAEVITSRFQNGYMTLSYIVKSVTGSEFAIFGVVACLIYIPVIYLIRKRSDHQTEVLALWILLGFFSLTLNIVKQSLAMVCILLAYEYLYRKKYFKFFLLSLIACSFHISSIYIVLVMMISQYKWNVKKLFNYLLVISSCIVLFMSPFLIVSQKILPASYKHYIDYYLSEDISRDYKLQLGALVITVTFLILLKKLVNRFFEISIKNRYCIVAQLSRQKSKIFIMN